MQRPDETRTGWDDWRTRLGVPGTVIFGVPLLYMALTGHTWFTNRAAFVCTYGAASLVNLGLLSWAFLRWARSSR